MANDIDMWNDIEYYEEGKDKMIVCPNSKEFKAKEIADDLLDCYHHRYQEFDEKKAEELKNQFHKKYGYWGNWY